MVRGGPFPEFSGAGSMYDHGRLCLRSVAGGQRFRQGGLKGFLERSLSPEVMLTRSSLDVPPAEKAVHSWAPTQEPLAVSTSLGGGSAIEQASSPGGNYGWN